MEWETKEEVSWGEWIHACIWLSSFAVHRNCHHTEGSRENTRPFRYDLNHIPYDYTVEATNRLKGLDLIDRVPEELWMEAYDNVQKAVIKTIPKKRKRKKAKWLSEEALQIAEKRREVKGK